MILPLITGDIIETDRVERISAVEYYQDRVCFKLYFYSGNTLEIAEQYPSSIGLTNPEQVKRYAQNQYKDSCAKIDVLKDSLHYIIFKDYQKKYDPNLYDF